MEKTENGVLQGALALVLVEDLNPYSRLLVRQSHPSQSTI